MKKLLTPLVFLFFLFLSATTASARTSANLTVAATSTCSAPATTSFLAVAVDTNVGGVTLTVSTNAGGNTISWFGSGDGGTTWVALNATPSNSTTAATTTTSTGTWQANVAGYTHVCMEISTLSSGSNNISISASAASARSGGGGGSGSGTVSGQANGVVPLGTTATSITQQSHIDDGVTTGGTVTSSEPVNVTGAVTATGGFVGTSDGVHPGALALPCQTTLPALATNAVTILGCPGATNTAWSFQMPTAIPTTNHLFSCVVTGTNCVLTDSGSTITSLTTFPITIVSGVSGAVPCFTSTTVESAGTLLATNGVVVGGGAGACPTTAADFTIGATAHTLIGGASGLVDLHAVTPNGFQIPYGTFPASGANGTIGQDSSTAGLYFANGSGRWHVAVVGGSGAASTDCTTTNKVITGLFQTSSACTLLNGMATAQYTNATTGLTSITGIALPLAASSNEAIHCHIIYQGSASTASPVFSSTGPASPTKVTGDILAVTTAGAGAVLFSQATDGTTFGFSLGPTAIATTATDLNADLYFGIVNGANAGTFQLQAKSNGTGTITIQIGSYCAIQ